MGDVEIGKIGKREYEGLKRKALKFERKNYGFVLVIPCDGEQWWCEMGDNSALIYKYQVCMKLGVPVTMTDDLDSFYVRYEVGRIRTRGFDTVRRRLKTAGLYKAESKRDKCVIFQLKEWTREVCIKVGEDVAEMQHRIEQDMAREEAKRGKGKK